MKAIVVADDEDVAPSIRRALRLRWPDLELAVADTARSADRILADDPPDMMFVSEKLSDADVIPLVRQIRQASDVVVFVVGSAGNDANAIEALEAGADDYLSTSTSESLLVARVCASLRRARKITAEEGPAVKCGDLLIDPETYEVHLKGKALYLTPTEFRLLYHLAQHQERVVTQQALENVIWGSSDRVYIEVLRKHVQRLRQKLESRRGARMTITTIPRVGYKLAHKHAAIPKR